MLAPVLEQGNKNADQQFDERISRLTIMPTFDVGKLGPPPRPGNNRTKLSREARTRVHAVVCLYRRPANWPPRLYHYRM